MGRNIGGVLAFFVCALLLHASPSHAGETLNYSYDELGRLVGVSVAGTVTGGQNMTTSFDPAGNRTAYVVTGVTGATISIGNAAVTEGGSLTFTVTRSGNLGPAVSANFATSSGTATSGSDFTAASGTVSFPSGSSSQTITVATIDDTAVESAETMTVTLSSPSASASLGTATGTGTINDNDTGTATISIGSASVTEGGALSFTVTRSGTTTSAVSASYATASGTATSGSDFTAAAGTVSFAAGVTTQTITVATIDDTAVESTETMTVTLSSPSAGATIGTAVGTGTINDNDSANATISIGNASVTEGGTLSFTVTRSGTTTSAVSASYATASGTATSGSDFTAKTGTVSFAAGVTTQTVTVVTIDDTAVESAETMTVALSSPSAGAVIGTATGTGTITDNDTANATISMSNASTTEGGTLSFTVTRAGTTTTAVSASYATASGTATSGSDFTAKTGTVSFAAGVTTQTITVATIDDTAMESAETMTVTLSSPSAGAVIGTNPGTGTIADNDTAGGTTIIPLGYSASSSYSTFGYTGLSGNGAGMRDGNYLANSSIHGTNNEASAWIQMDLGSAQTVGNVVLVPADAAAQGQWGASYLNGATLERSTDGSTWTAITTVSGALEGVQTQIPVNAATRYLRIRKTNNFIGVGDFFATTGGGGSSATLAIGSASTTEGGTLSFTVTRSGDTSSTVSASYATASGTATSGSDFTAKSGAVSFAAGVTSQTITVVTIDDTAVESSETMTVTLSSPSAGAVIGTATGTGTIADNDAAAGAILSINNASATEGGDLNFTITRTGTTTSVVTVTYATASGTATSGSDFTGFANQVTFNAGETSKSFFVPTIDDTIAESTETMSVNLSNPTAGASLGTASGTGTILDNDSAGGAIIIPTAYTASSMYSCCTYSGLSGTGAGMRDGDYLSNSSIHGTNSEVSAWIQMDLGSAKAVGNVVLVPAAAGAQGSWGPSYLNGATLERSTDGSSWTTVATVTSTVDGAQVQVGVNATTRYLRIRKSNTFIGVGDFFAKAP